jgi:hypothetical protein
MKSHRLIFAIAVCVIGARAASAQTFDFTADKFREAYNSRLRAEGRDGIAACWKSSSQVLCHFRNDPFATRHGRFGRIDHDELMTLDIIDNKVSVITLVSQRTTPATQARFIGQVGCAIGALNPALDKDKIAATVAKLGLSRGDDAPNIGEAMAVSAEFGEIGCLNEYSSVSMVIACTIAPRSR